MELSYCRFVFNGFEFRGSVDFIACLESDAVAVMNYAFTSQTRCKPFPAGEMLRCKPPIHYFDNGGKSVVLVKQLIILLVLRKAMKHLITGLLLLSVNTFEVESECYGSTSNGYLKGGVKLPAQGENFE